MRGSNEDGKKDGKKDGKNTGPWYGSWPNGDSVPRQPRRSTRCLTGFPTRIVLSMSLAPSLNAGRATSSSRASEPSDHPTPAYRTPVSSAISRFHVVRFRALNRLRSSCPHARARIFINSTVASR